MEQFFPMSSRKLSQFDILKRVARNEITVKHAAELLAVTPRTVFRKKTRLDREGPKSLAHGLKGRRSNHRMSADEEARIAALVTTRYADFKPGFAAEKLRERHGIDHDPKTIRRIMIGAGLWKPKRGTTQAVHRACYGHDHLELQLVQGRL
jgi:transposase